MAAQNDDITDANAATNIIVAKARSSDAVLERATIGLIWTTCRTPNALGLAMSPRERSRLLSWPGTLAGRPAGDVAAWLKSWDPFEATIGLAAANAVINVPGNAVMDRAQSLESIGPPNLAVFEHFRDRLYGRKTVVIGRYPGLDTVLQGLDVTVLERMPQAHDLPEAAAEFVVPEADWVFLTATTLINKTFPRLAALSRRATTVLMGPSCPWLSDWALFGIDYVAGVRVIDPSKAEQIAAEGGGTRLFGDGVGYAVAQISQEPAANV